MRASITDNKFLKVMIATQRAKQIHKGARPLVQNSSTRATRIALEEVERGLISFDFTSQDPDLKSKRDDQDVSGHGDKEIIREVANQLSVARLLSVGRVGD
jgi:DNA-directed RNA polymerase subunit omega